MTLTQNYYVKVKPSLFNFRNYSWYADFLCCSRVLNSFGHFRAISDAIVFRVWQVKPFFFWSNFSEHESLVESTQSDNYFGNIFYESVEYLRSFSIGTVNFDFLRPETILL